MLRDASPALEVGPMCPVEGCCRQATGPVTAFRKVPVLLCPQHRREYECRRRDWAGTLDPLGHTVLELHHLHAHSA